MDREKLILELMEFSEVPDWKWTKVYLKYDALSMNRLKEIRGGFRLAAKGLKERDK